MQQHFRLSLHQLNTTQARHACVQCRIPCRNCMHHAASSACSMHTAEYVFFGTLVACIAFLCAIFSLFSLFEGGYVNETFDIEHRHEVLRRLQTEELFWCVIYMSSQKKILKRNLADVGMNALAVKVHKHTRSAMHTVILICTPYHDHPYISSYRRNEKH